MDNAPEIFEKSNPWVRLALCVNIHVKKALLQVVHNEIMEPQVTAIPSDSMALYTFLQNHKNKIQKSTHIKAHQKAILLPNNCQTVDSTSLDISLIRYLIQTFNGIKNANKDWKEPAPTDQTLCAYVFRAANFRNQICHDNDVDKMDETTFEKKWEELKKILQGLKYVEDIDHFKTETLEYKKLQCVMLEEFVDDLRSYKEECLNEPYQDDYIKRRFYVDRKRNNIAIESNIVSDFSSELDVESIEECDKSDYFEALVELIKECDKSDSSSESDDESNNIVIESDDKSDDIVIESYDKSDDIVIESYDKSDDIVIESDDESDDIVIESDLENIITNNDIVMIYAEAGMGKSSTAKRIKKEWCNQNIFKDLNILYFDSKKMNKQLRVQSHAAPLYFSELGHFLKDNGRTEDDLSIYSCVKTTIEKLIILIDGIDEFSVRDLVTGNYVDELERKVKNNEKINAADTIVAIYFGFLFPNTKICLLGRNNEFERLKEFLSVNTNRRIKDLKLLKFNDANVQEFTCLNICKQQSNGPRNCTSACIDIYEKIKDIKLCKIPTDLNSLIKLHKKHPNENIGRITRTKLIIATLLNRLNEHINRKNYFPSATFGNIRKQKDFSKYLEGIRTLGEISFKSLLKNNITVRVEEEQDSNDIIYFKDENRISIERKTLEQLDLFYVRDLDYYFILEPHHTLHIEFLCACYLFSHPDEWDSIPKLNKDRQLVIIKFIAGLYADDYFTKDFMKNVLDTSSYSLEQFLSWLYNVEDVRNSLPDGGDGYNCWFGLMETQKLSPSLFLLNSISHEVEIPQTYIPTKTIVCYCDFSTSFDSPLEWYDMEYFKHNFLTKLSDKSNIELFLKKFPSFKFIIKGNIEINDDDDVNRLNQCGANNFITFRINELDIWTSLDTWFSSHLNVNTLHIWFRCDSRTINMILNALSPPPTTTSSSNSQPALKCKQLRIYDISLFNSQQTEKLFELCLCGVVDYIRLWSSTFFTEGQLAILSDVERKTNTLVNIEFYRVNFDRMFALPNFGNRPVYFNNVYVTDNILIELRNHIPPGYSNNFANYRIINPFVPFVRKENYSRDSKQSMCLCLNHVDFTRVSPEVFASTLSIIPSLSCVDYRDIIPSSHWLSLSQTEDCRINEMRIWRPRSENFDHFLNIKTRVLQFICSSKDDLEQLLNYIVNNQNIQLNKHIKCFVVKVDLGDWNYYEEITLFGEKAIVEYKDNYSSDNLLLDNIRVPFHEGEQHLNWCCEISQSFQKKTELCDTNTYYHLESSIEETNDESPIVKKLKIN